MAVDIVAIGLDLIAQYGLIAIFVLLVLDGAMLLPVFPGELVLIIAVTTYATDPSGLLMLVVLSSTAAMVGALMLYGVTRGGGRRLVERYPRLFMMPRKRRERLEKLFARPLGQTLVLFLRLLPLTRVLVSIPAGLARMPIVRFIIFSALGMVAYHAAFLWFAFETRRPGSPIEAQTAALREAYANPAWEFVRANTIITGLVVVVLGAILSIRASQNMLKDPEETGGTLVGSIATATLFWGGIALALGIYTEPETVYSLIALGGVDIERVAAFIGYGPAVVVLGAAALMFVMGWILRAVRHSAKAERKRQLHAHQVLENERRAMRLQAAIEATQARIEARQADGPFGQRPPRPGRSTGHGSSGPHEDARRVEFDQRHKRS